MSNKKTGRDLATWNEWDELESDVYRHVLDQVEKKLSETSRTAEGLTNRSMAILQLFLIVMIGCIGYLTQNPGWSSLPQHLCLASIVAGFFVVIKCIRVYKLYDENSIGNTGSNILSVEHEKYNDKLRAFLYGSIQRGDDSIAKNQDGNVKRSNELSDILNITKWWIIGSAVYTLLRII